MCQVRDEDGRTPLHLAVMNGQHESVSELIQVNYEIGEEGAILHLCVMYNRLNILILILESTVQDLSNTKDDKGNTILHSAIALKRTQIIKYLLKSRSHVLDVNAANENGLTALDMIEQMPKDVKTMEIKELLISASTLRAKEIQPTTSAILMGAAANQNAAANTTENNSEGVKKKRKKGIFAKTLEKSDKNLLVAASVIAAMAYQAAISPPGGVASVDAKDPVPYNEDKKNVLVLQPGGSLLDFYYPSLREKFWISNTISFMAALSVIFLYVNGAGLKRKFMIWLTRLGMWISLTAMAFAYVVAVLTTTPSDEDALMIGFVAWVALLCLSILVIVCRFLFYIVRTIFKTIKRMYTKKNTTSQDAAATFRRTPNANIV